MLKIINPRPFSFFRKPIPSFRPAKGFSFFFSLLHSSGIRTKKSRTQNAKTKEPRSARITPSNPQKALTEAASTGVTTVSRLEEKESIPLALAYSSLGTSIPTATDCAGN